MDNQSDNNKKETTLRKLNFKNPLVTVGLLVAAILLLAGGTYGYLYVTSPGNIRHPSFDHYHFRTQIVVDGQPVDFSRQEFQEDTSTNTTSCSIALNGTPIDFHDNEDQMTHIHWGGITGGQFLKYYGWNLNGGESDALGRRYDQGMMRMHQVNIKGAVLPEIPEDANFYVYTGDESGYEQKSWEDFLSLDLEDFFGKQSNISGNETTLNIFDLFTQKVFAHGVVEDGHDENGETDELTLERINNLIGNIVIFVQVEAPSSEQIQERFNNLVPLHESTCGG